MTVELAVRQEPRSRLAQLEAMPDEGMLPVRFIRQVANEIMADRVSQAVARQLTIQMWRDICTRNLSAAPADDPDPRREEVDHG